MTWFCLQEGLRIRESGRVPVLRQEICADSFAVFGRDQLVVPEEVDADREKLKSGFKHLERDEHSINGSDLRRRYGKGYYTPIDGMFKWSESSTYVQEQALNASQGGRERKFSGLSKEDKYNRYLHKQIDFLYRVLPWSPEVHEGMVQVGVHLISMNATRDLPCFASPPYEHQDGEPFTAIVLLELENARGGESIIRSLDGRLLHRRALRSEQDTIVVDDEGVEHVVEMLSPKDPTKPAVRNVILIDFTPMVANVNRYPVVKEVG